MSQIKTTPSDKSVLQHLEKIADEQMRHDCLKLVEIMRNLTKAEPKMWGDSMVGFGEYRCRYASGRECDWFITGFAPRKSNLSLYFMDGFDDSEDLLMELGPHSLGKSCLYIKRLSDIHLPSLKKLIRNSVKKLSAPRKRKEQA